MAETDQGPSNGAIGSYPGPSRAGQGPKAREAEMLSQPQYRTGYTTDTRMLLHRAMEDSEQEKKNKHPEAPARVEAIYDILRESGLVEHMKLLASRKAEENEVLRIHSQAHWNSVQSFQFLTDKDIEDSADYYDKLSLYVSPHTTECAELASGCTIDACLAVARGEVRNALAIVRPPGHHAEPEEHMGFSFFNNVAIAARAVQQLTPLKRILILDWDVHHGNGTQKAFYHDPSILYISLHRHGNGFYPGGEYGNMYHCGVGDGLGKNVNIPFTAEGMGDSDYLYAFIKIVMPIAYEFAPELVIVSAGFDAAMGDTLGGFEVSPLGYAHMTHMLSALAGGKMAVVLEGGYTPAAVAKSVLAVTKVLLGEPPDQLVSLIASPGATETVYQVALAQSKYWKTINPQSAEPEEEESDNVVPIVELLKAHRSHDLFEKYRLSVIPFASEALENSFSGQVICSRGIYEKNTLFIFLHDFGNVYAELASSMYCDVKLEHTYIVDASRKVLDWAFESDWAILDVNVLAKPRTAINKASLTVVKDAMLYLWDNYIELADAKQVVFIGYGSAVKAMNMLFTERQTSLSKIKAVVQVVGLSEMPIAPAHATELGDWYKKVSLLVLPSSHTALLTKKGTIKRHGSAVKYDETRVSKLFGAAMPRIKEFVHGKLS